MVAAKGFTADYYEAFAVEAEAILEKLAETLPPKRVWTPRPGYVQKAVVEYEPTVVTSVAKKPTAAAVPVKNPTPRGTPVFRPQKGMQEAPAAMAPSVPTATRRASRRTLPYYTPASGAAPRKSAQASAEVLKKAPGPKFRMTGGKALLGGAALVGGGILAKKLYDRVSGKQKVAAKINLANLPDVEFLAAGKIPKEEGLSARPSYLDGRASGQKRRPGNPSPHSDASLGRSTGRRSRWQESVASRQ